MLVSYQAQTPCQCKMKERKHQGDCLAAPHPLTAALLCSCTVTRKICVATSFTNWLSSYNTADSHQTPLSRSRIAQANTYCDRDHEILRFEWSAIPKVVVCATCWNCSKGCCCSLCVIWPLHQTILLVHVLKPGYMTSCQSTNSLAHEQLVHS